MSEVIAIEGGHKLNGTVVVSGAKNATVALIPAIVLADSPVTVYINLLLKTTKKCIFNEI